MVVKKPRIVIVGAGMAGLTAAHRLFTSSAGGLFDLSVVDAGDRIGGRILTADFAGDRVEMGATWIHGIEGSPVYALAGEIGALVEDSRPWERMDGFPSDPVTVAEGGGVVDPAAVVDPVTSLYRRLMDAARSGEAETAADGSLGVGPFLRRGLQQYRASRASGGDRNGAGDPWNLEALEEAVFAMHECQERTCTSADDLADLDLAAESEYRDFPGDQITIAKGYSRIVEHLAAALPAGIIRLGQRLRRIEWLPDGGGPVRLHFVGGEDVAADHVILTVSLGVLKAGGIEFYPALPAFKLDAIGRLGFGLVNKLFMEMEAEAEAAEFPFLQMAFGKEGHVAKIPRWIRRTQSICPIYGGSRVLLAWFVGKEAMQLEALNDDEEVIRGVHATIDAFLPPSVPARIAKPDQRCNGGGTGAKWGGKIARVKRSQWGTDPLFLGSYSYVAVGSSGDDLDLMAEPLPRGGKEDGVAPLQILFAGEATHRTHYSTTHGAYFSGIREANRLLQYYGCTISNGNSNSNSTSNGSNS
ncbi:polyamine oxidase 1 [Typha latifolia]|uniref:polyamine oxidase 1 n=1 Tax=Typha latifolia TaxID=4733 RepID=UPI003C2CC560